ncbi:hypothetical protein F4777DRAFT_13543 [Nemania sp. FL0916]|nr:hypothetical protein F4777DRAFT_13543 [Nemania sp. FL0916]
MARHLLLRLRHLLPLPLSFRLASHLPPPVQSCLPGSYPSPGGNDAAAATAMRRKPTRRLHATSYLDGLRGLAALVVCLCHYTEENHPALTAWYGVFSHAGLAVEPSWVQLPFIRTIFSGRPMVHVFFVISGFALSVRALAAARAREWARCQGILASAAFRRPIRLCAPPVVATVCIALLMRAGWLPGAVPTWRGQIADWAHAVYYHVLWPWSWDTHLYPPYNVNLWTIPVELCHSMLLFLMVLALSRVCARARIVIAVAFVIYSLHCGKWAAAEFIAGMVLAEMHLVSAERRAKEEHCLSLSTDSSAFLGDSSEKEEGVSRLKTRRSAITGMEILLHIVILTSALFIAGWPNVDSMRTPGIRVLASHAPHAFSKHDSQGPQKFWFALAAIGTVWSCGRVAFIRRAILESRVAQYAGRISFAVYIVHGPGT